MAQEKTDTVAANRRAWNRAAPHHRANPSFEELLAGFRCPVDSLPPFR